MNARKIATSLPASQYVALERMRKRLKLNRSEAVQQALAMWLAARGGDERLAAWMRGYADVPDDPAEGDALARAWATGQGTEDW